MNAFEEMEWELGCYESAEDMNRRKMAFLRAFEIPDYPDLYEYKKVMSVLFICSSDTAQTTFGHLLLLWFPVGEDNEFFKV